MLDNQRWDDIADLLTSHDFYSRPHAVIWNVMVELSEQGLPMDLITLSEKMETEGTLDSCGGFAYLAELSKNTPSAANIRAYAEIVRERAVVRDTGFTDRKKKTAGLQPSDLIIVAARPSMGKTTFAMNLVENAAMANDKPALVFSLEMPGDQLLMRSLASLSRVDQTRIRTGQLDDEDWARISGAMGILLENKNIFIDDSSGLTPTELRSRARRVYRDNGGLSMIMIDYLQLMRVPEMKDNRTLEIAEISRSLKALAKELQVPVVALSQLNRSLEQRSDKRPVNSDLRESGAIEQDADLIMFLYRDEVYHENTDMKGIAEVIIGKQRNGPIGTVRLTFNGQYSRFDNYAGPAYEDEN